MRIGINGAQFIDWTGGLDFLTLVTKCTNTIPGAQIHVLVPTKGPRKAAGDAKRKIIALIRQLATGKKRSSHAPSRRQVIEAFTSIDPSIQVHEIDTGVAALSKTVKSLGLEVILPSFRPLPPSFPIPWIGYLYDYQHKYYPGYFTEKEIATRNRDFLNMLSKATTILVNANSVINDTKTYHPNAKSELFALPFSPSPKDIWLENRCGCTDHYKISKPYLITCNQFWLHKDHRTLFKAFAKLAVNNKKIELVCTGPTTDYRNPEYLSELKQLLSQSRITERVHILGSIPKLDQIDLIKNSIALVQPTLFEGGPGGGSAYDAISVGTTCIASNIPVNLEIDDPATVFFEAGNADSLFNSLQTIVESQSQMHTANPEELKSKGCERTKKCGHTIERIIENCLQKANSSE